MKTKKRLIGLGWFVALLLLLPASALAQNFTLKGKVLDSSGEPLPGATVVETGNLRNATMAGNGGAFSITLPATATITVSFMGYEAQVVEPNGRSEISVTLQTDEGTLIDEVVAIGYGTARRGDLTSSVSSVNSRVLEAIPVTSPVEALAGRMAGVNVTVGQGGPDGNIKMIVRGGGSITQSSEPLFVVDGFPVANINDIAPGDIERVDVLKDASSTAIYGAKGANGVVYVTTKSGKAGKTTIDVNTSVGFSNVYRLTPVLSPYEYVYFQRENDSGHDPKASFFSMYGQWEDMDLWKADPGIDWQDMIFGNTGIKQNYNVALRGGTEDFRYSLSYTRDDEKYIMLNSNYKRDNIRVTLNKQLFKRLNFDFSAQMSNSVTSGPNISGSGNKLRDAMKYAPVKSLSAITLENSGDPNPTLPESQSALNSPIKNIENEYRNNEDFNNRYNAKLTWEIIDGLTYTVAGTYGYTFRHNDNIHTAGTGESARNGGQPVANRDIYKGNRWTVSQTLTYAKIFGEHHSLNLMVGQEADNNKTDRTQIQSKFYPIEYTAQDVLAMWNYGEPTPTYTNIGEPTRTASFFGRVGYTFKDRYLFNVSARMDGTNVFAPENRWGVFPSASAAWKISEEPFMTSTKGWLSSAKLRASYGIAGNANVGSYWRQDYTFESGANRLYYPMEMPASALKPGNTLKNETLTWEEKLSAGVGLDLGFFNERLTVTMDYYHDTTRDLILRMDIPRSSGYQYQYRNLGQTTNTGFEFAFNAVVLDKPDFLLSVGGNISFNRNVIDKLDGADMMLVSSGWGLNQGNDDYRAIVGKPIGQIWGYKGDGFYSFDDFTFNPELKRWTLNEGVVDASSVVLTDATYYGPGHIKLKKLGGEGNVINATDDRTVIGSTQPLHTGGFNINASWKGFDMMALFNWSYGNDVYNANKIDNNAFAMSKRYQNASTEMSLDKRFSFIDPVTGRNVMYGDYADPERFREINQGKTIWHPILGQTILTDWAIEDGSFLRLGTLTLGYTLPERITKRVGIQRLRIYGTGYNVFCLTGYSGQDPEVNTRTGSPLTPGVDYSAYPKQRTWLFGINLTF